MKIRLIDILALIFIRPMEKWESLIKQQTGKTVDQLVTAAEKAARRPATR